MPGLAYGLAIEADLPLGLPETGRAPDVVVRALGRPVPGAGLRWLRGDPDGPWSGAELGDDYLLRYAGEVDLVISGDGTRIGWYARDHRPITLVHLIVDHALPYALMRRGNLVLHAATLVSPQGGCLAITGPSGQGKSTLAAALVARGHRLLGDDCAAVALGSGHPLVAPAYPGLRLHRQGLDVVDTSLLAPAGPVTEGSGKLRLALCHPSAWSGEDQHRLELVLVLQRVTGPAVAAGPTIADLGPAEALLALLPNSFHVGSGRDRQALVERAATLVEACQIRRLAYHHSAPGLQLAVDHLEAASGASGERDADGGRAG